MVVVLFSSCWQEESNTNDITRISVTFYDNNKDLWGNSLVSKLGEDYLKNLKIKVIPYNNDKLKNIIRTFFYDTTHWLKDEIAVPLSVNSEYRENNYIVNVSKNPEEFEYLLMYKDEIIFKKTFQFFYKNGNPWDIVTKINVKNAEDKWEEYKPKKIEIIKNEESTDVFFEVN